jgi:aminoglycoside phosphotransferase (APT) family kinase protein
VRSVQGIDGERVPAWLAANIDGAQPPFQFELIAGGRSNLTYAVTDTNGWRFVLRRPPLGHVLATAHDMAREHRIVSAVGQTDVPVARTLGLCTDPDVNGAPFYVMSFVDGDVLDSPERAEGVSVESRRRLSEHLIDVLADLHAVDVDALGLGDFAKRDGYIERQLKRWSTQWEQSKTRDLADIGEAAAILRDRMPAQHGVSIVHGDYRFGNCLVDVDRGRINAVLDWELCTLGDPLADVGYLGLYWYGGDEALARSNDPTPAGGFPDYREIVDRYSARTGRDLTDIDYYIAFSCWRGAVISEGVYNRYIHGAMGDAPADVVAAFHEATLNLAARALSLLR